MSIRFDVGWFKNKEHKNLSKVKVDINLSDKQKTILKGIHKRHLSYADGPSEKDLDFLQEIYGVSMQSQNHLALSIIHCVILGRVSPSTTTNSKYYTVKLFCLKATLLSAVCPSLS